MDRLALDLLVAAMGVVAAMLVTDYGNLASNLFLAETVYREMKQRRKRQYRFVTAIEQHMRQNRHRFNERDVRTWSMLDRAPTIASNEVMVTVRLHWPKLAPTVATWVYTHFAGLPLPITWQLLFDQFEDIVQAMNTELAFDSTMLDAARIRRNQCRWKHCQARALCRAAGLACSSASVLAERRLAVEALRRRLSRALR